MGIPLHRPEKLDDTGSSLNPVLILNIRKTIINGNFRILKWRYVSTICLAIFWGYISLHRPEN